MPIFISKFGDGHFLLALCESNVNNDQNRKHNERGDGRPLQQESEHDEDEGNILRMSAPRIPPRDGE